MALVPLEQQEDVASGERCHRYAISAVTVCLQTLPNLLDAVYITTGPLGQEEPPEARACLELEVAQISHHERVRDDIATITVARAHALELQLDPPWVSHPLHVERHSGEQNRVEAERCYDVGFVNADEL